MTNEIIPYFEMCQREGLSLQRGMNFQVGQDYSIVLMSVRPNAPYADHWEEDGLTLIYEGHDQRRDSTQGDPKLVDQPSVTPSGSLTENGKFSLAAEEYKKNLRPPERARVYEKIRNGIWSYNGMYALIDAWQESDGKRQVYKFKLRLVEEKQSIENQSATLAERTRAIPTAVKVEVWKRDGGRCVICGSKDELHFDHIIPYSKGGTSLTAANVQLLCARHNVQKRDRIE